MSKQKKGLIKSKRDVEFSERLTNKRKHKTRNAEYQCEVTMTLKMISRITRAT